MALVILEYDDILGRIQLRPECAEALGRKLLAAEADKHELPAEVRVQGNVADEALRHLCFRRVDGDAAAVLMIDRDHIVHVGVLWKKVPADAGDSVVHHADDALDRGIDAEDVAGAAGALAPGIGIAHPGFNGRLRQVRHDILCKTHGVQVRRGGHEKVGLVDPAAAGHIFAHGAEHDAVAHDLTACRDIAEGDLVRLGDVLLQHGPVGKRCSLCKITDGDGDIVAFVDFDTECFHSCLLKTGRENTDPLFCYSIRPASRMALRIFSRTGPSGVGRFGR